MDFLQPFVVPSGGTDTARLIQRIQLNPRTLFQTGSAFNGGSEGWLAKMSQLYEKFRFKSLTFHYRPSVGTTTAGNFFMASDADIDDDFTGFAGGVLLGRIRSLRHSVFFPCYGVGSGSVALKITDPTFFNQVLYCDPSRSDDRWAYSGCFYFGVTGPQPEGTYGLIDVSYEIEFSCPNIDDASIGSGTFGSKVTTTEQSRLYPFGQTWIPGSAVSGVAVFSNVDLTITTTIPGTANNASVVTFGNPGTYAVIWEHTGLALATTILVPFGGSQLVLPSFAYTFNTSTRESGVSFISISAANTGFYCTHAAGPTVNSLKLYFTTVPIVPPPPVSSLSRTDIRTAEKLSRLLATYSQMSLSDHPVSPTPDVVEVVDLTATTTSSGVIDNPGNPPITVTSSSTSSIVGTIDGPDPPMSRSDVISRLLQDPFVVQKLYDSRGS